ncbi:WD40-repeat-containing domain protein [Crepidotus variabilis]|uniref:WD40-repeat-containing domain protein n=1 Tax=Crepidotus variabilis TaxID=179855 RepID=A0A9P6JVW2_9AGAR|nr:WD40-repeat-containing domain protein [Crepidotus variabilis]
MWPTRPALAQRTNILETFTPPKKHLVTLPTPPDSKPKRQRVADVEKPKKRRKVVEAPDNADDETEDSDSDYEIDDDEDVFMGDISSVKPGTPLFLPLRNLPPIPGPSRRPHPSTLPILQSFVSAHKSDVFRCQSVGEDTYLTPPYTCSYSHGSKKGGKPLLAVATEQGTVHIFDTSKRNDWDPEPQRVTLQSHQNGVFDIAWSSDDRSIATCSGDQSTRFTDLETGGITNVLRGHTSTVKCMAWDHTNPSLLGTGGRDGAICLWDLRIAESHQSDETEIMVSRPVITIPRAHDDSPTKRKGKQNPAPRTITDLLYSENYSYGLISSCSFDGILRLWDLRAPSTPKRKTKVSKPAKPLELCSSSGDPTTLHGSRRPRGIISITPGSGPSAGHIFAIGADSRIHTYDLQTLTPQRVSFQHENLQTNSFYVGVSVSPCGRWLACGGSGTQGNSFVFDVENAVRPWAPVYPGVELRGQRGEVGAVDWARDMLAACTDDGTVRIWRPDIATSRRCLDEPEQAKWDWSWAT